MDQQTLITFLALVFGTIFLLSQVIIVPAFGTERHERKRIRKRLEQIAAEGRYAPTSLLRQEYLKQLSPIEKWLDTLPGTTTLNRLIEQSGQMYPAYRLLLKSLFLALAGGGLVWVFAHNLIAALVVSAVSGGASIH
jgi:tight adherence protein B